MASCAGDRRPVRVLSYNVQNLFDATTDGGEYQEFTAESGWTHDSYYRRLMNLNRVIDDMLDQAPDIIVLHEIEGIRVVEDLIADFVPRMRQVAIVPSSDSVIRSAVLSRLPLGSMRVHLACSVALEPAGRAAAAKPVLDWQSREMLDVDVPAARPLPFRLIACHWKSQSGGERQTEPRRIQEAALIHTLLAASSVAAGPTIIVGDLNEDVCEFQQHGGAWVTALMPSDGDPAGGNHVTDIGRVPCLSVTADASRAGLVAGHAILHSPWLSGWQPPGSYYHAGRWERLDQFLFLPPAGGACSLTMKVIANPDLLDDSGVPRRYDTRTGYGYSDHLPVIGELTLE